MVLNLKLEHFQFKEFGRPCQITELLFNNAKQKVPRESIGRAANTLPVSSVPLWAGAPADGGAGERWRVRTLIDEQSFSERTLQYYTEH